ncbi:COMM domain-containing protein 4 [Nilaparvata lugens]|uniref:COMM domain-containing protein 4 n=1 Tax=Nilaparvata lugens TaxID=108931 RepID=UPI00193DA0F0|nr:COMM domain-containing protein 4 [Nilaparvata lugens]XP_039282266.1 COMM domain-containing protein 4 [Nilaparvata lugens]
MRFKFCGEGDCPDWVLLQINALSRMSSVKMKILCQTVAKSLVDNELDFEKVKKLTADAKLELDDIKTSLLAIAFIMESSTRYNTSDAALSNELQQIGLPHEHSQAICRVYNEHSPSIAACLVEKSLRTSRLRQAVASVHGGHFDLQLDIWRASDPAQAHTHHVTLSKPQMALLISELKTVKSQMAQLQNEIQ